MSHIERKVAKKLLDEIRRYGEYAPHVSIPEIDYIDPFDKIVNEKRSRQSLL
jgi:fructose 1,6-bisphosphatase